MDTVAADAAVVRRPVRKDTIEREDAIVAVVVWTSCSRELQALRWWRRWRGGCRCRRGGEDKSLVGLKSRKRAAAVRICGLRRNCRRVGDGVVEILHAATVGGSIAHQTASTSCRCCWACTLWYPWGSSRGKPNKDEAIRPPALDGALRVRCH